MRIIAGRWRGRELAAPEGRQTRPTAGRLRQALFDMLAHAPWSAGAMTGARVLDAFAGSGALGLEALSRGAAHADFLERDRAALTTLRRNVLACGAGSQTRVLAADATAPPSGTPCSLLFLDPPYGEDLVPRALAALQGAGWIAPEALVVAELGPGDVAPSWPAVAERRHGAGRVVVMRAQPAVPAPR